ncbi:Protein kinase-like domain [Cordyceps javanica]|uniref:Protein kinase-like domain n=1 Tax=Cordyceps javanica TaxID=43265 RepID=A0A545VLA8_9HYPO|nr:Protein kinase-like domain [Cordyceps javanica]TQW02499.1 Protein kinase-like domain [Cordyceps javanica]
MDKTKSLTVHYDAVLYAKGDDQYRDWNDSLKKERFHALEEFVTTHITDRGPAKFVEGGISSGSYNQVFRFSFSFGGSDIALKVPKPGHSARTLAAEKLANEAAWLQFFKEKTTIPVPHVYSCGTEPGQLSPLELPYILMDWVPGDNLRKFLASAPPKELLSTIYQQIAFFYLELYRVPFAGIGSVAKNKTTGQWSMRRPLTIDMHELVLGISNFPTNDWPSEAFLDAKDYLDFVWDQQSKQLWSLRNLNTSCEQQAAEGHDPPLSSEDIAALRYQARHHFKQLSNSPEFRLRDNLGPFRAFNPDLDTRNMTVDTKTGKILGVFDLEFTNAMPAQFACDPPLSLFKVLPGSALDRGYFAWFLHMYEPVLEQFLDAMRREELKLGDELCGQTPLSSLMRNSWETKRVWFNFGLTHSDYVDAIFWAVLHDLHPGGIPPELPAEVKVEMERYKQQAKAKVTEHGDALSIHVRKTGQ